MATHDLDEIKEIEFEITAQCELGCTYIYLLPDGAINASIYVDVI